MNENIRNALSAAHIATTTIPQKKGDQSPAPSPTTSTAQLSGLKQNQSNSVSQLHTDSSDTRTPSAKSNKSRQLRQTQSLNICNSSSNSQPIRSQAANKLSSETPTFTESLDEGALRRLIRNKTQKSSSQPNVLADSLDERTLKQALQRPSTLNIIEEQPSVYHPASGSMLKRTVSNQVKLHICNNNGCL